MAIDQDIELRKAAFRGNPQGLQQRYQMTQELVDLLALQKLKSEQDAIAREMTAQMDQKAGTVADQLNQEMLARSKDEVVKQVSGIMQNQMRREQQNMARMARMGPQMARPQMPAARPQMAMARPQTARSTPPMSGVAGLPTPMMRMNGGGIIGYSGTSGSLVGTGPLAGVPSVDPGGSIEDMELYKTAKAEADAARKALEGAYSGTPTDVRVSARDEAAKFLRREDMRKAEEARIDALNKLDAQQMDPEKLARQRRIAALLGASGKTRGYVGAGFAAGDAAALEQQEAAERNRLLQRQAMERDMETRDVEIGTQGLMSGRTAEEQRARGLGTLARTTRQYQQTAANVAESQIGRTARASEADQQAIIAGKEAAYQSMRDTLSDVDADLDDLIAERDNIRAQIREREEFLTSGAEHENNVLTLQSGQSIEINGETMDSLADYADYLRRLATEQILSGPVKTEYDKVLKRIEDLTEERTQLRNVTNVTPAAPGT